MPAHASRPHTTPPIGHTLFDTAIGRCGIAWSADAIVQVNLPMPDDAQTRARLLHDWPDTPRAEPTAQARDAIAGVVALMRGEPRDLLEIRLDMAGVAAFERRVYELTRAIAPGHTRTYGEIARDMGEPGASRAVGRALGRNPFAPIVPCHRVLAAGGATGGFSANGGVATKMRMLLIEGARVNHTPDLFDQN